MGKVPHVRHRAVGDVVTIRIRVIDNTTLADTKRMLQEWKAGGTSGPVGVVRKLWTKQYEVFVRRRFNVYSRGGGDWPPLQPKTIRARRRGPTSKRGASKRRLLTSGGGRSSGVSILKDTGILFNALSIGAVGNAARGIPSGIAFGFASASHKGGASIATIARAHDSGAGHLPRRRILVKPDKPTADRMAKTFVTTLAKAARPARSVSITGPGV